MEAMQEGSGRVAVRATVSLPGLGVGSEAIVDPANPYIASCLAQSFLVPVGLDSAEHEHDESQDPTGAT